MNTIHIAVACHNASGVPQIPVLAALATQNEIDDGRHYEQAINLAEDLGYHGPMICFDANEYGAILTLAKELNLVPQVV